MDPTLLSWCAGFFDGEGSISLRPTHPKQARFRLSVSAVQKRREPIDLFHSLWSGSYSRWKAPNGNPMHEWFCSGDIARTFLTDLFPYLRVKRRRAKLAIAYLNLPWRSHRNGKPGGKFILRTAEQKRIDSRYSYLITSLNAKGGSQLAAKRLKISLGNPSEFKDAKLNYGDPRPWQRFENRPRNNQGRFISSVTLSASPHQP